LVHNSRVRFEKQLQTCQNSIIAQLL